MPYINFASVGSLVALEETESIFVAMESELQKYIKRALLPVDTYVQLYKKYHETWNLHIPTFIEEWSSQEHTSDKVKELVEFHITHRKQLEDEIPHEINITGIRLIVENVRNGILRRKQNLCNALLDSYAKKLRGIIRQVKDAYNEIERKFNIRSEEITEVVELMAYVESISDVVEELESTTINVIKDYEIFDYFMYQISHDDSNATWQAALSSQRIMKLSRQAAKWLEADYNRLLQTQQSFLSALSDQVDSAALMVAGLVRFMEMEKASEANPEVQKVYHMVKDLQEHSELLNGKQKVFNLPLLQNHALEQLAKDIEPFKNLWSITAGKKH
jgi:DNA polymerase III gamma/tau subunit